MTETSALAQPVLARHPKVDLKKGEMRRANRMAWLVVEGQTQGSHCQLREFSGEGAQLTVSGLMGIPDKFLLYVVPDSIRFNCTVLQRKGNSVSVRFDLRQENVRFRDLAGRR